MGTPCPAPMRAPPTPGPGASHQGPTWVRWVGHRPVEGDRLGPILQAPPRGGPHSAQQGGERRCRPCVRCLCGRLFPRHAPSPSAARLARPSLRCDDPAVFARRGCFGIGCPRCPEPPLLALPGPVPARKTSGRVARGAAQHSPRRARESTRTCPPSSPRTCPAHQVAKLSPGG